MCVWECVRVWVCVCLNDVLFPFLSAEDQFNNLSYFEPTLNNDIFLASLT